MSQIAAFLCSLCTSVSAYQTQKTLAVLGSGSRSLYLNRLDCVGCSASASSTHKLPLSHTNAAIMQSLLPAWCCTVLLNMLLRSYLLFFFVWLPSVPFSPPFRRFRFWSSGWRWRRTSSKSVWTTRRSSPSSSREERRPNKASWPTNQRQNSLDQAEKVRKSFVFFFFNHFLYFFFSQHHACYVTKTNKSCRH